MKKLLIILAFILAGVTLCAQTITPVAAGGTWQTARTTINTNFDVTSDSLRYLKSATDLNYGFISTMNDSIIAHNIRILARAPLANPMFSGIIRLGADTIATRAYARSVAGSVGTFLSISDTANMLTPYIIRGDTASMLSNYAKTSALSAYLALTDTANMLTRYIARSDTASMLTNYIARGDTAAMLSNYALLSEIGTGDLSASDTASMLAPYSLISEVRAIVSDSLQAALDGAETGVALADSTTTYVTPTQLSDSLATVTASADLSGDITIGTNRSNYLKINSELYLDSLGVQGADTVALVGIVVGDSVKIEMHPLVTASGGTGDVTTEQFTDSIAALRSEINLLYGVLEDIYTAMGTIGVDIQAPTIDSLEIGRFADDTIRVWWSEPMVEDSIPPVSTFYLTEDDEEMGIASIYFENDSIMGIVLDSAAVYGATYLLDYTRSFPRLQDTAYNSAANFTNRAVTNYMTEPEPEPENMIANGSWDDGDTDWTYTAGFSVSGGQMVHNGTDAYQSFTQADGAMAASVVAETDYRLQINVTLSGANSMYFVIQSSNGGVEYGTQAYACGTGTTTIDFTTPADIGVGGIRFRFPFEEGGSGAVNWVTLYER